MKQREMRKSIINLKIILVAGAMLFAPLACTDLDEEVFTSITQDEFLSTSEEFIAALGAAYGPLTNWASNQAPFSLAEVSTDEFMVGAKGPDWFDGGHWIRMHQQQWEPGDPVITDSWPEIFQGISAANRLLFQFENSDSEEAAGFINELRGLRAMYYYYLMDFYGNVPIVDSFEDETASNNADFQAGRVEAYNFIESELNAVVAGFADSRSSTPYGRIHYWVARALQAKLYINASIYKTGMPNMDETADLEAGLAAVTEIIDEGPYVLEDDYFANFEVANENSGEIIFNIVYDNVFAQGNNLAVMSLTDVVAQQRFGLGTSWNGFSTLTEFYDSYINPDVNPGPTGPGVNLNGEPVTEGITQDVRNANFIVGPQFNSDGDCIEDNPFVDPEFDRQFRGGVDGPEPPDGEGFPCVVYTPVHNELGPNGCRQCGARLGKFEFAIVTDQHQSFDYPLLRLADMILLRAEYLGRLNGYNYNTPEALALVNQIRTRAGVDPYTTLDEDLLLQERGREMWAESTRRQDLIRFPGTNGGLTRFNDWWLFKNDLTNENPDTSPTDPIRNVYPIPLAQIEANDALTQNPGYGN